MKRTEIKRKTPLRAKPPAHRPPRLDERSIRMAAQLDSVALMPTRKAVMARASDKPTPAPKHGRYISEAWRRAVASLPCVLCGKPSQAAHRNEGKGMGLKTDDSLTAALCPEHHSEVDQGRSMDRAERRAYMDRAIVLTLQALARDGKVVVA